MHRKLMVGVLIFVLLLGGCKKEPVQTKVPAKSHQIKIGLAFDSFLIERWQKDRDILMADAMERGAKVLVQSANGDSERQIEQIESFIKQKVDIIIIACVDSYGLSAVVHQAKREGIIVIAYDRLIKNSEIDLFVTFKNQAIGEEMGKSIMEDTKKVRNVIMINGSLMDGNVLAIENGFLNVMDQYKVKVLDKFYCEGWDPEYAENYLLSNRKLVEKADAIMCGNDGIASVVIRTLSKMQMAGDKLVTGQDAELESCQHIVEGTQKVTIYKPLKSLADATITNALKLYNNKRVDAEYFENGNYKCQKIALDVIPITKENIDKDLIETGFQSKSDVYLNVKKPELHH